MAPPSFDSPPPPAEFASRELPVETIPAGSRLSRIHLRVFDPLHFGAAEYNRFDDRRRLFGVCYLAMTIEGAFAETFLRTVNSRIIFQEFMQERSLSALEAIAPLRLSSLHGPGLARVGATSAVASGSHSVAQLWSQAIHDHPAAPDGIAYRSKHDDDEICIALFDRARDRIVPAGIPHPMENLYGLAELFALYDIGLE